MTHETRVERAIRRQVADELRWLAAGRKQYCHRCPESQNEMRDMSPTDLGVHDGHATADWLADIVERKNDAKGWLPSWLWDEWEARA